MLELKLDIIPFGDETKRRTIGKLLIENILNHPDRPQKGNYICHHDGGSFVVRNFDRSSGAWALVKKCLSEYIQTEARNEKN